MQSPWSCRPSSILTILCAFLSSIPSFTCLLPERLYHQFALHVTNQLMACDRLASAVPAMMQSMPEGCERRVPALMC